MFLSFLFSCNKTGLIPFEFAATQEDLYQQLNSSLGVNILDYPDEDGEMYNVPCKHYPKYLDSNCLHETFSVIIIDTDYVNLTNIQAIMEWIFDQYGLC